MPTALAIGLVAASLAVSSPTFDAARASVSAPVTLTTFSSSDVKGFPIRLSWSPDGRFLSIRVVQRDRWANEKTHHYLVQVADGKLTAEDAEPGWSSIYWYAKAALACPGEADFKFDVESRVQRVSPTGSGAGGSLAQNSGDPYGAGFDLGPQGQAIIANAQQAQNVSTTTMRLRGQVVSEFVNTGLVTGLLYGWAPEGMAAIAYASEKRELVLMDKGGARQVVGGTKGVLLPAWSPDGSRIVWVEQGSRHKYALKLARVTM